MNRLIVPLSHYSVLILLLVTFAARADNTPLQIKASNKVDLLDIITDFLRLPLLPPTDLQGSQFKNIFVTQQDIINKLAWQPSASTTVTGYNIYRDGVQIATNLSAIIYQDHNRASGISCVYEVTAVDENGSESISATVTIE